MVSDLFFAILVNHLWQSTLFAAAIWGLTLLLRNNSARLRYALWLAASLKFLLPFAVLAAIGAQIPWHAESAEPGAAAPAIMNMAADLAAPMAGDSPFPQLRTASDDKLEQLARLDKIIFFSALTLWLVGALFVAIRWLMRWIEIRRALRRSTMLPNIDFPAPALTTEQKFEPGVVGILRPKLLLPAGIEERLTPEQMRAVLAHERCHLRWRDNFTAALHMLVETLFWFFPPVWWIGKRLIDERERACDEQVVRDGHAPERYAEGILNVCEHYIASRLPCVSGVSGSDLRKRIQNIIKRTLGAKLDGRRKLVLAASACCAVAAPIAAGMISGSTMQVLFSLAPGTAAMQQYWLVDSGSVESSLASRSGPDLSKYSCPDADPGAALISRQKGLATLVAKMPATHDKALLYAVAANSHADVKRLLAVGAPRKGDGFTHGDSLMGVAVRLADVSMLSLLVDAGFNVNERNELHSLTPKGETPLIAAISAGRLRNARWLIEHGADPSVVDQYEFSPLTLAMVNCRDKNLVALLLQAGAKPNFKALRVADGIGFDLRTDPTLPGPPLQSWRQPEALTTAADFDGDSQPDQAALHLSLDGKWEGLFVRLSHDSGRWTRATQISHSTPGDAVQMEMSLVEPGTQATACRKGYGKPCKDGEPAAVTLKHPGIRYSQPEGASSIFYWDESAKELKRAWTSD